MFFPLIRTITLHPHFTGTSESVSDVSKDTRFKKCPGSQSRSVLTPESRIFFLRERECVGACTCKLGGGGKRGRDRIASTLPAERGAQWEARSLDPEITT